MAAPYKQLQDPLSMFNQSSAVKPFILPVPKTQSAVSPPISATTPKPVYAPTTVARPVIKPAAPAAAPAVPDVYTKQYDIPEDKPTTPAPVTTPRPVISETPAQKAEREYYESLNRTQPNEDEIRRSAMAEMQAQIDAINSYYNEQLNTVRQQGIGRLGETRALGAATGVLGSPFGTAQKEKTIQYNTANENAVNAERNLKISAVLGEVNKSVKERVAKEKETANKNSLDYINYLKNAETQGQNHAKTLAQSGVALDEYAAEDYQKLLKASGLDETTFKKFYNDTAAKAAQEGVTEAIKNGTPVDASQKKVLDAQYGAGWTDKFIATQTAVQQAKTAAEKASAAKDIIAIMKDIPTGTSKTINGVLYEGIGEVKGNKIFQEIDPVTKQKTYVTVDSAGNIINTSKSVPVTPKNTPGSTGGDIMKLLATRGGDGFLNTGEYAKLYDAALAKGAAALKAFNAQVPAGTNLNPNDPTAARFLFTPQQRNKASGSGTTPGGRSI